MEDLHQVNQAFLGKDGEVIFTRKGKKATMLCPYAGNQKACSHSCPLLVEMSGGGTMERTYKYLKFCNGAMMELAGDERT